MNQTGDYTDKYVSNFILSRDIRKNSKTYRPQVQRDEDLRNFQGVARNLYTRKFRNAPVAVALGAGRTYTIKPFNFGPENPCF